MEEVRIYIREQIDPDWSDWLSEVSISHTGNGETLLTGRLRDQSSLYGLIGRLPALGLQLASLVSHRSTPPKKHRARRQGGCENQDMRSEQQIGIRESQIHNEKEKKVKKSLIATAVVLAAAAISAACGEPIVSDVAPPEPASAPNITRWTQLDELLIMGPTGFGYGPQ